MKKFLISAALFTALALTSCGASGTADEFTKAPAEAPAAAESGYAFENDPYYNDCYSIPLDTSLWTASDNSYAAAKGAAEMSNGHYTTADMSGNVTFYYTVDDGSGFSPNIVFSVPNHNDSWKKITIADVKNQVIDSLSAECADIGATIKDEGIEKIGTIDFLKVATSIDYNGVTVTGDQYMFMYNGYLCTINVTHQGRQDVIADARKALETIKLR